MRRWLRPPHHTFPLVASLLRHLVTMSCLHLFALVVLATCGLFCAVHANMEAKRMGSEFLGKRSPSSRLDVADVLPGGFWEEELAARSPAAALRVARLLRAAAGVNRFGGGAYDNDDDDDLDLAMAAAAAAAKQKRIGSEFLGKRSSTSDLLPKRMGSEFLGRRKRDAFHSSPDA
ncbi:uncharacterized protein [Dermacentor albipictus]|uniref:uncharacterized protein isoform X1 n=1 Tax=Dermacentor albipictus TaxID=60249 RepID=UPI0031FDC0DA